MRVFLSWSGARSKEVADAFAWWLPQVIQSVDPWVSSDIDKGARWNQAISDQLELTRVGIICLTADNLTAPWLLFEAGAISKTKDAHVCTFLLDVKPAAVQPPLGQFQHTLFQKTDIKMMVQTINKMLGQASERALTDRQLADTFDLWWSKLETRLQEIVTPTELASRIPRPDRDLLEEILEIVRGTRSTLTSTEESPTGPDRTARSYHVCIPESSDWNLVKRESLAKELLRDIKGIDSWSVTRDGNAEIDIAARNLVTAELNYRLSLLGYTELHFSTVPAVTRVGSSLNAG